jgi:hypothetical protein
MGRRGFRVGLNKGGKLKQQKIVTQNFKLFKKSWKKQQTKTA